MSRIAFQLGPVQIHWYGILAALAIIFSLISITKITKRYGLDQDKIDSLLIKLLITALVGARLGFVVANLRYFLANPGQIIRVDQGGLGSHGAIILTMFLGYFWLKKAEIPYWQMADAVAITLPISHICIRLGNFINGELYGPATNLPWGVKFLTTPGPVHPSQLYEALASVAILFLTIKWAKKPAYHGYCFLRVMFAHSIVRFFVDFVRPQTPMIGPFTLTQLISFALSILSLLYILHLEKINKSKLA